MLTLTFIGNEPFDEINVILAGAGSSEERRDAAKASIMKYSPTGKVPVLFDEALGSEAIYDSMAIALYLHIKYPAANLFPADPLAYAQCLSACAEMHSGFMGLRSNMPHNCVSRAFIHGAKVLTKEDVRSDIARVAELWTKLRETYASQGPYLFGQFSAADCFYAPIAFRLFGYDKDLSTLEAAPLAKAYVNTIINNELVQDWVRAARGEPDDSKIAQYEAFCDPL